jgi:uncharacterized protein with von Willebrand factor type A (vWA) domain
VVGSGVTTGVTTVVNVAQDVISAFDLDAIGKMMNELKTSFSQVLSSISSISTLGTDFNSNVTKYVSKIKSIS